MRKDDVFAEAMLDALRPVRKPGRRAMPTALACLLLFVLIAVAL